MIEKKLFHNVNEFDENFDLFYGDSDLCFKVRKNGFKIIYTPHSKLLHEGSATIKKESHIFFAVENYVDFTKKWPEIKNGDPFYNANLSWQNRIEKIP